MKKRNEIADKILVEVRAENAKAEAEKAIGKTSGSDLIVKRDNEPDISGFQ